MKPAKRIGIVNDFLGLCDEARRLTEIYSLDSNQIGLTFPHGTMAEEQPLIAVGSLKVGYLEGDFSHWLAGTTLIRKTLETLGMSLGRIRIMRVTARKCYSVHRDPTKRIHIPLITHPQSLMIWPDIPSVLHMPADGGIWLTDTTLPHTAMNGSMTDRLHIVAALAE